MNLDVSRLPHEAFVGEGDWAHNMAAIPKGLRSPIEDMAHWHMIKTSMSFGCAFAKPNSSQLSEWKWDDPYDFVWLVAGWGPECDRYIANAVRKLRPTLRTFMDTLTLRIEHPEMFEDVIESVDENGNFAWGDFPWGGATFVHVGDLVIPSAVSCLLEVEDDAVAKLMGGLIGAEMLKITKPEEFGLDS